MVHAGPFPPLKPFYTKGMGAIVKSACVQSTSIYYVVLFGEWWGASWKYVPITKRDKSSVQMRYIIIVWRSRVSDRRLLDETKSIGRGRRELA